MSDLLQQLARPSIDLESSPVSCYNVLVKYVKHRFHNNAQEWHCLIHPTYKINTW